MSAKVRGGGSSFADISAKSKFFSPLPLDLIKVLSVDEDDRRASTILCFEHCGKKVFSMKDLPDCCPVCQVPLLDCALKIPPFAVPSPFKKAVEFPCSIVIKPTKG